MDRRGTMINPYALLVFLLCLTAIIAILSKREIVVPPELPPPAPETKIILDKDENIV